jgi:GT2 family glycosyltransferase
MAVGRTRPTVSVIIINYNGGRILPVIEQNVEGVKNQTVSDWELILVDDGSTDGSGGFLASLADGERVHFVQAPHKGVGPARNAGLKIAQGQYLAFIDNDAIPATDWLERILAFFETHPNHGAVASLVFFADRPGVVNSAGCVLNELAHGMGVGMETLYPFFTLPEDVLYATGNGMVIRREALEATGWFDEGYRFYGHDDSDIGIRIRKAGYEIAPVGDAILQHLHSVSKQEPGMNFWDQRNRLRFVMKHYSTRELARFLLTDISRHIRGANRGIYLNAWTSAIQGLGGIWRYRTANRGKPPYFDQFARFFTPERRFFTIFENRRFARDWHTIGTGIKMGENEKNYLYQGWYWPERRHNRPLRWARPVASFRFVTEEPIEKITLSMMLHHRMEQIKLKVHLYPWSETWHLNPPAATTETTIEGPKGKFIEAAISLPPSEPGKYLLVFEASDCVLGQGHFPRQFGWGLAEMEVHPCAF